MCGLIGFTGFDPASADEAARAMLGRIAHRGPDDEGFVSRPLGGGHVALGFRRLAILDLSPSGHQPMAGRASSWLVFNGEIYNYRALRRRLESEGHAFAGSGDTEVLLKWLETRGPAGLADLEGMYSLAWIDGPTGRLLLARDPFGIKPLYYAQTPRGLAFGSEVRAVAASGLVPRTLSRPALATALAYGAVQRPLTIVEQVFEFPPGHMAWHTPGGPLEPTPFFRTPKVDPAAAASAEEVRGLVTRAVRSHLTSDVPVGILLSSGLDSTVVAAACRGTPGLKCFTLGFRDDPADSEMGQAAAIAASLDLEHTPIWLDGPEALARTRAWLDAIDQPSVDGLNVFAVTGAVREAGVKVALSGLGSDELFGGYPSFRDVPRLHRWMRRAVALPRPARVGLAALAGLGRSRVARDKLVEIAGGGDDPTRLYFRRRRLSTDRELRSLGLAAEALGLSDDYQPAGGAPAGYDGEDLVPLVSRLESRYYQGNMLLRDADACSMAHGLELRVPFLDLPLARRLLTLPGGVLLPSGRPDKHLLRQAFAGELSACWKSAPKRGFVLPIRRWLLGPLADTAWRGLDHLKRSGAVRPEAVDEIWGKFQRDPNGPAWTRAFMLVVAGHYLARNGLS